MDNVYSSYLLISEKQSLLGGSKLVKKWCVLSKSEKSSCLQYHASKGKLSSQPKTLDLEKLTSVRKIKGGFELFLKEEKVKFQCVEENSENDWIQTFQSLLEKGTMSNRQSTVSTNSDLMIVDDVVLYQSFDTAPTFTVSFQQNADAIRCNLLEDKRYTLAINKHHLAIYEKPSQVLYQWPYMYIRRFGRKDGLFHVMAGRRCPSGEGTFLMVTEEGNAIFDCITENTKTKNANKEMHQNLNDNQQKVPDKMKLGKKPEIAAKSNTKGHNHLSQSQPTPNADTQKNEKDDNNAQTLHKSAARSVSQECINKHKAVVETTSNKSVDSLDFKNKLAETLLLKGSTENPTIGENVLEEKSHPITSKKTPKELRKEKEHERKERERKKQEEKERQKQEEKKQKELNKKKDKKRPNLPPPPSHSEGCYDEIPQDIQPVARRPVHSSGPKSVSNLYEDVHDKGASNNKTVPLSNSNPVDPNDARNVSTKRPQTETYARPHAPTEAWRSQGKVGEHEHFEDYENIKRHAIQNRNEGVELSRAPAIPSDDEDENYASLGATPTAAAAAAATNDTENVYGISSGKSIQKQVPSAYEEVTQNVVVKSLFDDKEPGQVVILKKTESPSESSDFDPYDTIT